MEYENMRMPELKSPFDGEKILPLAMFYLF